MEAKKIRGFICEDCGDTLEYDAIECKCPTCEGLVCDGCMENHASECFIWKEPEYGDLETYYKCNKCDEFYDNPEDAEECCKQ